MANPNPIIRDDKQELKRQISFTRTMQNKVFPAAEKRVEAYEAKIADLEAQLQMLEQEESA